MSRKKKRLIEHFDLVIESGNFESFKKVFEKCEIDAKIPGGKTTRNAFSFKCLTPEHIQFLVDNGLEVNADCGNGLPAVAFHAANKKANQVGYEFFDLYSFDIENTLDSVAYEEPSACSLLIVIPMEALLPTF